MNRVHLIIGVLVFAISIPLLILPGRAMGGTHYVAANGSDSNDGTSKTTPWLHAPGMPSCTGSCKSYTPVAGDQIIFRGGDTWHFANSGAAPFVGAGAWSWNWSGSKGSPIYIGVDQTWYSGSSWVRPVFNGDNPLSTSVVSSCPYLVSGGNQWIVIGASYVTLDNFEFVGMCWDTSEGAFGNNVMLKVNGTSTPDNVTAENLYFHGWTHTAAAPQGGNNAGSAFQGYNQQPGIIWQFNVIDGSDSDHFSLNGMESEAYIVQYSVFRYFQGNYTVDTCHKIHDNLFEHIDNVTDGSNHSDVMQCAGEAGSLTDPNLFYNNIFRYNPDTGESLSMILGNYVPAGLTDYDFNNIFHDNQNGTQANYLVLNDTNCSSTCTGSVAYYNNTMADGGIGAGVVQGCGYSINNHWISNPATITNVWGAGNKGLCNGSETNPVYMTDAQAVAQGYTSANDYAPTSASNSTAGAGTNNASFCNGLSDSVAKSSCLSGTTMGCQYVIANHTVSCPGITLVARPSSGAWDVGAYQWSSQASGNQAADPTNLLVIVQ